MNRQLRRAQEKAEQKQSRDKQKAKAAKREKRTRRREKRASTKSSGDAKQNAAPAKRRPDLFFRFAGPITIFTTVFIVLQSIAPRPEENSIGMIVEVAYYFIFGYGFCLYLMKRGQNNALQIAAGTGVGLAVLLQGVAYFVPTLAPNLILLLAGSVTAVLGALAGRWVANRMM